MSAGTTEGTHTMAAQVQGMLWTFQISPSPFDANCADQSPVSILEATDAGDSHFWAVGEAAHEGDVIGAYFIPDSNQSGDATDTRTLNLYNKGSDGSGTDLVATKKITASVSACVPIPLTLDTDYVKFDEGDVLALNVTKNGNGVQLVSGTFVVEVLYQK